MNATFAIAILDLISRVHLTLFVSIYRLMVELFNSINSFTYIHTLEEDLQITTDFFLISEPGVSIRKSIQRSGLKTAREASFLKRLVRLNTSTKTWVTDSNLVNAIKGVVGTLCLVNP